MRSSLHKVFATLYTLLLGFVLPFICWGTLATPGHPHQMPHLVFLMPLLRGEALVATTSVHQHHDDENSAPASAPRPVGRSAPAQLTTAIPLFSLLLTAQTLLLFYLAYSSYRLHFAPNSHLSNLRVITPPPRRLYL